MESRTAMPSYRPLLQTEMSICEDMSYSISPKYITVNPYLQNFELLVIIHKEIKHIHNLIMVFEMNYKMYKRYLYEDFDEKFMKFMNEKFTQIYKIINLTYNKPASAFDLEISDMDWYVEIAKVSYLENESSKINLTSIFEVLLEMSIFIDALNIEIQDKYDNIRRKY